MTELAAGAVSSLLVVVRDEAVLLGGVQDDVQFIKEEMESMKSFLAHLARSTPRGREHDEQVQTWMNQVRLLAQDCHNCIDLYLYSGNPDIHRAKSKLRRYLWWVYWFLHKLLAQHRAAVQLRQLKDRARDVGERRLRYGVEVPAKPGLGQSLLTAGPSAVATASSSVWTGGYAAAGVDNEEDEDDDDDGEDGDDDQLVGATVTSGHSGRRAFIDPRTPEEYVKAKLWKWAKQEKEIPENDDRSMFMTVGAQAPSDSSKKESMCMSVVINIMAPYTYWDLLDLVQEIWVSKGIRYQRMVLVDIPAVHWKRTALQAKEVLFYILRKLQQTKSQPQPQGDQERSYRTQMQIYHEKNMVFSCLKIEKIIKERKIYEKLDKIKSHNKLKGDLDIDVFLEQLQPVVVAASQQDRGKNKDIDIPPLAVKKLKELMEGEEATGKNMEEEDTTRILLYKAQYKHILQKLLPKSMSSSSRPLQAEDRSFMGKQATKNTTATLLGEDEIKQIIHDAKKDIIRELQEGKYDKGEGTGESAVSDQNPETVPEKIHQILSDKEKIGQMIDNMKQEFKEQLMIKRLMEDIKKNLNSHPGPGYSNKRECTLFILKVDKLMDVSMSTLEDTRNALSLLNNSSNIMIVTTAKEDSQVAKEYCYPQVEPIDYSLAGLYHDTVVELTGQLQKKNEDKHDDNHHLRILHDILDKCKPHEFCMKIFTHALYANPKRSTEELHKLHSALQNLPASSNRIAKVMFKFSYNDLPKEYKSCLLYLAIFPPGHKIRRSTLTGRWVAEGLTSKEDWHSSVRQANRCFDALVDRCLVYPADIGATGNVKGCVVGEPVHGIITTIARKQHILETRLSHHLARHFSVFNDLQLRSSEGIGKFFQGLCRSSRVSMLKVLDLEGCECFNGGKNQRYLKEICRKMLLLKYLSLRRTDITLLPREINNLRELEVLDIRQTKVPPHATASILLLKLKRLLAGNTDWTPRPTLEVQELVPTAVQIPHKIYKMLNMEVLRNVKAQNSRDLQVIGKLCQLRKLGVVIDDKVRHLAELLETISDLYVYLRSLSITTIQPTPHEALGTTTPSKVKFPCLSATPSPASADESPADGNGNDIGRYLKNHPKILQSLSISGTTTMDKGSLLSLFIQGNKNILAKVTLSDTVLTKDELKFLAKLPKLRCVRLQHIVCTDTKHMLAFEKDEFISLKYLLVEGSDSDLTNISFVHGSAPELEKMVLSFTGSISGVDCLKKLRELELNNNFCGRSLSSFDDATKIANKLTLRGTKLEQDALRSLTKNPNIHSLVLLEGSFSEIQNETIILKKDEFLWLNLLDVECLVITKIIFTSGSAPRLEKIVWSSSTSLSGIDKLPRLKELEFKGGQAVPDEVMEAIDNHQNKPSLKLTGPETQG